jgi:hypothetical protein
VRNNCRNENFTKPMRQINMYPGRNG